MKTIRDFLRKHALLLLAALVVVSVPVGGALGKYAASETVTDKLNLNVSMKTYTLKSQVWSTIYSCCKGNLPNKLVLTYNAPSGLEKLTDGKGNIVDLSYTPYGTTKSGSIYAYYDTDASTVYIAPETPGKMYANDCTQLFYSDFSREDQMNALTSIVLENLDTSNAIKMTDMFSHNRNLLSIDFGSNFNTANVNTMEKMFYQCRNLTTLDLRSFNTASVTNMLYMFADCQKLTSIDLSSFDTSKVTTMYTMFCDCTSLTSLDLSNFDTSSVKDMSSMFCRAKSLTSLNLSGKFNTSNVNTMASMFKGCWSIKELDLRNFDTSQVTDMNGMFDMNAYPYTSNGVLNRIIVSDKFVTDNVTNSGQMFNNCASLIGGENTSFNSKNPTDKTYARIDGGTDNPGYFTAVPGTQSLTNSVNVNVDSAYGFGVDPAA